MGEREIRENDVRTFFQKGSDTSQNFYEKGLDTVCANLDGVLALTESDGWAATFVGGGVFGLYCEEVFVVCESAIVRWRFGWIV